MKLIETVCIRAQVEEFMWILIAVSTWPEHILLAWGALSTGSANETRDRWGKFGPACLKRCTASSYLPQWIAFIKSMEISLQGSSPQSHPSKYNHKNVIPLGNPSWSILSLALGKLCDYFRAAKPSVSIFQRPQYFCPVCCIWWLHLHSTSKDYVRSSGTLKALYTLIVP